jgi:hypothetical protein
VDDHVVPSSPLPLSVNELELAIHGILKECVNTTSRLEKLRFQPRRKSKINIPLCRMVPFPVVRPFLKDDVMNLAAHFVACGYMEGNRVFYVALENNEGKTMNVIPDIMALNWSNNWVKENVEFEEELNSDDDLRVFSGKMFMVWDGNHRLQAWLPIINNEHKNYPTWHFAVESIILVVNGDIVGILTTLHEVNWYVLNPIHPFFH